MFHELPIEPHKVYHELISHYKRFFYNPNYGLVIVHQNTLVNMNPAMTQLLNQNTCYDLLGQDISFFIEELQHDSLLSLSSETDSYLSTSLTWKPLNAPALSLETLLTHFKIKQNDFYLLLVPTEAKYLNSLKSVSRQFLLMLQNQYRPILMFDGVQLASTPPLLINQAAKNYFSLDKRTDFTLERYLHPKDKPVLESLSKFITNHKSTRSHLSFLGDDQLPLSVTLQSYPISCDDKSLVISLLSDELMQYVEETKSQFNHQAMQNFFNYTKSAMVIVDKSMVIREMNIGFTHQFKYPEDDIIGKDINNFLTHSILNNKIQTIESISQVEFTDFYSNKHELKVFDIPIYLEDEFIGKYLLFSDANSPMPTELKRLNQQLFNLTPEQVLLLNQEFEVCWTSGAFSSTAEFPNDGILEQSIFDSIAKESQSRFQEAIEHLNAGNNDWYGSLWFKSAQNKQKLRSVHFSKLVNETAQTLYYALTINHIQTDRELEQLMVHFAFRDPYFELPNHIYSKQLISEWIYECGAHQKQFSVFKLNFEGLEQLVELGGDTEVDLIQSVLLTLTESLDTQAKITRAQDGGFMICHKGIRSKKEALHLIHTLLNDVKFALENSGHNSITCNLGLATFPQDGTDYESLLCALETSAQAHQVGESELIKYEQMLLSGTKKEGMIIRYLKEGLHNGEFYIVYQPLIDLKTKKVIGIETLLRWDNESVGNIPPKDFIPLAEKSNFIVKIGYFVIGETVRKLHSLREKGHLLTSSVNISLKQLEVPDFYEKIINIMNDYELPPDSIQFEITESITASSHPNVMSNIAELTNFGMTFNVDDFGTGYSSLKQMKDLKIKGLKIDHSLIQDMVEDPSDLSVVTAISAMAKNLGLRLIAEGVETEEQLATLEKIGFEEAQGFLFSVPLVDKDIEKFIEETNGKLQLN